MCPGNKRPARGERGAARRTGRLVHVIRTKDGGVLAIISETRGAPCPPGLLGAYDPAHGDGNTFQLSPSFHATASTVHTA
ncbi:hypothetical protein PVAP13_5NG097800 [Panicum virgatum]|uniref:Uncharacterized protein n=1 Tax=Panicum virgatum TaxID=38727 RepID=A0A8T0RQJ3_PANVG|nr:hypothetical protein PVAP13_5NG097800 [Panicum virgatum]